MGGSTDPSRVPRLARMIILSVLVGGLLLATSPLATAQEGSTLHVDPSSSDAGVFQTIQSAVDAAEPGDHILVHAGTYEEAIQITTENVSLQANGDAFIDGRTEDAVGLLVQAPRVTVVGFTLTGQTEAAVLVEETNHTHIEDNRIEEGEGTGVHVVRADNVRIAQNTLAGMQAGILLEETQASTVRANAVRDIEGVGLGVGPAPEAQPDPLGLLSTLTAPDDSLAEGAPALVDPSPQAPSLALAREHDGEAAAAQDTDGNEGPVPDSQDPFDLLSSPQALLEDAGISSAGNRIAANTVEACEVGILIEDSQRDHLEDNRVEHCQQGILLQASSEITLRANRLDENEQGLEVLAAYIHDIDTTNTVNDKPVHYYVGETGLRLQAPLDAGFLAIVNSQDVTLRNLEMSGMGTGPMLVNVAGAQLERLDLRENGHGLRLVQSSFVQVRSSHLEGNDIGLLVAQTMDLARGLTVENTTFLENGYGIYQYHSAVLTTIQQNTFQDNTIGGLAAFVGQAPTARDLHVLDNRFLGNGPATGGGLLSGNIAISGSPGNALIEGNEIEAGSRGIAVRNAAPGLEISNNLIQSARTKGIYLTNNVGLVLEDNRIEDNHIGLEFWGGEAYVLRGNSLAANTYNLHMRYFISSQTTRAAGAHDIDTTNTVDGRPVHYHYGEQHVTIDAEDDPGYIAVLEASSVTVRGVDLAGNGQGIALSHVGNVHIEDVRIEDTLEGIHMLEAENVSVSNATIAPNATAPDRGVGIEALRTQDIEVEGSNLTQAYHGIRLSSVTGATIHGNVFADNRIAQVDGSEQGDGLYVFFSHGVLVEDNVFQDNRRGIHLDCCPNEESTMAIVRANHLSGNQDGIVLQAFEGEVLLEANQIVANERGLVVSEYYPRFYADRIGTFEITSNVFAENTAYGIHNTYAPGSEKIVDARDNYWGAEDGPASPEQTPLEDPRTGVLADGSGDVVSPGTDAGVSNVAFDPFFSNAPAQAGGQQGSSQALEPETAGGAWGPALIGLGVLGLAIT